MSFENVQTQFINWGPVPPGGVSSKGPLNHLNVSDGVGGWLDSNANINPANQHMGNVNQISNVGNSTDFQISTDGSIRLDAPGALQIGNTPGTISYELPTDPPTAIGQTLVAQSSGPSSVITWSNTTIGSNTTATVSFLDSFALVSTLATVTLSFSRVGNIVTCLFPGTITAVFGDDSSYMTSNGAAFIPVGFRPSINSAFPFLYETTATGPNFYSSHTFSVFTDGSITILGGNSDGSNVNTGSDDGWDIGLSTSRLASQYFTWIGA